MIELPSEKTLTLPDNIDLQVLLIPSGEFLCGFENIRTNLNDFYIGKYPITVEQYRMFIDSDGYQIKKYWTEAGWYWCQEYNVSSADDMRLDECFRQTGYPQVGVSWYEAVAFCNWLSDYLGGNVTLPNEMEWEKSARGIDGRKYPWGAVPPTDIHCNFNLRIDHTTKSGIYPAGKSIYGCHDMAGNVWEWCKNTPGALPYDNIEDRENYAYRDARVIKGGCWDSQRQEVISWAQSMNYPNVRLNTIGFRVKVSNEKSN